MFDKKLKTKRKSENKHNNLKKLLLIKHYDN